MSSESENLTFWDHLDELRSTLIKIISVTLLFGIAAFCFKNLLFEVVLAPTENDFVVYRLLNRLASLTGASAEIFSVDLINISLAQQFLIHMKTALYAGLLCASPYNLSALMQFVSPALYGAEKRYVYSFVGSGYVMFMLGVLLCYFLIFPLTFRFLATYQVAGDVANMISLDSYISTLLGMSLMLGVVFEMPVLCWLFAKLGFLKASFMQNYRKHAVVVILIAAAIITPTSDAITLSLVSVPMWLLYELSVKVVSKVEKNKNR